MSIRSLVSLLLFALMAWTRPALAAQSYDNCTGYISSLPAVISTQGTWCLKQDLTTAISSGQAITISTNNVTLDCNDFKLGGLAAGSGTTTYGVYAYGHVNATVRHCNIRGFYNGVNLGGPNSGGHTIEDNRFDGNTVIGLHVEGDGSVVRRNRVFDTGGSTTASTLATGIDAWYSTDVLDNIVSGVSATAGSNSTVWGIYLFQGDGSRVVGNGIRNLFKDGTGYAYGVFSYSSVRVLMHDNDILADGSANTRGFYCGSAGGVVKDNTIADFVSPIMNCTDGGGNYLVP